MRNIVIVEIRFDAVVILPEDVGDDLTPAYRERAIEAALSSIPQSCDIFIDGENKDPARVQIDVSDTFNVEGVRIEPE